MCHISCIIFGAKTLTKEEIKGKKVIEIGSYEVNGSLRPLIESWNPSKYVGVDIEKGPGVDIVCNAENIVEKFGKNSFDIVVSTELLEHVKDWRKVISNIKNVCKPNGVILITTRSYGYPYHAYPYDFWRYEIGDMKEIFSDCKILNLEQDFQLPGVVTKLKKPNKFVEKDLSDYELYSIVANKRAKKITDKDFQSFYFRSLIIKDKIKNLITRVGKRALSKI